MEVNSLSFDVVDPKTGEYPNLEKIALRENWAKGLMYCDMDGFAIMEDGELLLLDDCGNFAYCPSGRFEIHTSLAGENNGRWSMFRDITSALYGKQCYFQQEDGTVYSRLSGTYMSQEDAYREFVRKFGED